MHRLRINIILLCICLSAGFIAKSQEIKTITLSEALDLGYKNSKQLAISNEVVKEAQARLDQAKDKALPDVGVSGTYLHINTPNIAFSTPPSTDSDPNSPLASLSNLHDVGLLQLNASMPLFNGLKIRNTKAMNEYLQQAAQYDEQTTHSQVALNTIKAVYHYYTLLESRNTIQQSLKQQEQRVKEFKEQEAQGLLARNDRLKTELQANTIELALTEVNHNVELAEYGLGILLGFPEGTDVKLDTTGMFEMVDIKAWDHYLQSGLESRTVLKSGDMQIKATESNYKIAKANRLPTLSLSAGYVNAYIPNVMTVTN
ncbi:MAG TPA: TolC family protein, partial [Chryseolinea sp.]|nr:TolC family protein [Chryseolinea sp.]